MSWSAAAGQVASYTVHLYQDGQLETSHENLDNRTVETVFTNRTQGVYYCVVVVSKSRTSETNSLEVCEATGELDLRHDCHNYFKCIYYCQFIPLMFLPLRFNRT